jgi:isopenicillin-N epimerase
MNEFGAAIRSEWTLDPDFLTVNHGSFGAVPRIVIEEQREWQRRLEAQPTRFMSRELPGLLREAAARLAAFLGAAPQDVAFLENTTVGCNAVLQSLRLAPGDEILMLSHVYNAVRNAARHVAERAGAHLVTAALPFPEPTAEAVIDSVKRALTPRTRLAIIDHITSSSALLLPLEPIIRLCRSAGVAVLVDGAHGPGQVPLDLAALDADYYVGNCHKWLMAPKGAAFLWARRDRQEGLHPVTISHGYGGGFLAEFDWTGTRDPSAFLAVPAAIDFHAKLGGAALMARNRALADTATRLLSRRLNAPRGAGPDFMAAMGLIRVPFSGPFNRERGRALHLQLLERGTDAPVHANGEAFWLRISAAAYNEIEDYERLAEIVAAVTREAG